MIEFADTSPDVNVQPEEYNRLLGFPRDWVLSGRSHELAAGTRAWFARNGRPWVFARQAEKLEITSHSICIDGIPFTSERLRRTLQKAEAHSVLLVAASAGPEIEHEAQKLWREEKPDEYFFLETWGSAVVEHLITVTGARLCAWAEDRHMAVLPHYSPGYSEWDIAEQPRLLQLVGMTREQAQPGRIEVLASGALRPKKSQLAVFGLTRHTDRLRRLTDLVPCEGCSFLSCQYRRAPYGGTDLPARPVPGLNRDHLYTVSTKALKRWAEERLSLELREDGTVDALFRYEGTTCTNMGRPLVFHYQVKLGSRRDGYPILEQRCAPAPDDTGHTSMCQYLSDAARLMAAIDREKPLLGRPLNDVLSWQRSASAAGCYCEPGSREHKWGLVLDTIHYALAQRNP
jgi:hypothetical protein